MEVYNYLFIFFNKSEAKRRLFWQQNMKKIIEHNEQAARGEHSYRLAPNHLADLHTRHYHRKLMVLRPSRRHFQDTLLELPEHELETLPLTFDWRDHGLLTQPLDQQDCGSCYAFSVAAAVQAQLFRKNGSLENLSPQQLVDCSVLAGNYGCNGGSLRSTARYVQSSGLMLESDYPYRARQSACKFNLLKQRVHINSWQILPARDEFALQCAHANMVVYPVNRENI
ncbi:cathepsin K-like isoform X2 [Rhodnius prolixus]|uniref:cathepsin K-like isoform X2 n=1 Tax=Rhodnius prolixus TaxID=13249 RepID=UPI003D188F6F